jgi:hypothetical protein
MVEGRRTQSAGYAGGPSTPAFGGGPPPSASWARIFIGYST